MPSATEYGVHSNMNTVSNEFFSALDFDKNHIWHPYNRLPSVQSQLLVESAYECTLELSSGEKLIDGMSSWWSAIHGYNHPEINKQAIAQIETLSHVMFGGLTHQPALELAQKLISITPVNLDRIFFADSGSISVEVALKVSLQYWKALRQPQKHRFLALKNAYHGDTFGAMSVCDPDDGMHSLFHQNLLQNFFVTSPDQGDNALQIAELRKTLETHHHEIAAFILEPIVQGAGGMRFYNPNYLTAARNLCDEFNVLLIFDEIATGFGRTGKLFASEWANVSPDIMTLGKGLTGGYISLAAMLCTKTISDAISQSTPGLLMHGPTFMANPLACRIANASIDLLLSYPWQDYVSRIEQTLNQQLQKLAGTPGVKDVRALGAIGVIELEQVNLGASIQAQARKQGVWLRPFGKLIYTMPAYTIKEKELNTLCKVMVSSVQAALHDQNTSRLSTFEYV